MNNTPLRVLILESDLLDAGLFIKSFHKEWNIHSRIANRESFNLLLPEFNPDIIFSGYDLPEFSDLYNQNAVKKNENYKPLIVVTESFNSCIALNEMEEYYRALTLNSPDVIMRFNKELKHIFVNQAVTKTVPLLPKDFLNKSHEEIGVFPEHLCRFWEECIRSVFTSGKPKEVEFQLENQEKTVFMEWRLFPEFNKNHEVNSVLAIARDISDKKESEKNLRASRQMTELILNNIPQSIFWKDRNSIYLGCNETFAKSAGLKTSNEIIGKSDYELPWKKDETDFFIKCDQTVMSENKPQLHIIETRMLADGTISWFDINKTPLHDESGNVIGILGTAENISEKKAAQEALRKSEERLQMALDATSDGIWDLKKDTKEIYFSSRYFSMLGYDNMDIKHTLPGNYKLIHPDDYLRIRKLIENFLESENDSIEYEMRLRRKDGSYAWIFSKGKVFQKDAIGKPLRVVGTHVDISLRKKQENIQQALFGISNAINTTRNLEELFVSIQCTLGSVVDTKNCYVALYDEQTDSISLPFHKDEMDSFTSFPAGKSLTGYVIKTGKALLANKDKAEEMERSGKIDSIGTPSESWLGVPLKHGNKIIGVFVVQSYDVKTVFTDDDVQILEFVSDQIALAIERKRDQDNLMYNQIRQKRIIESSPDGLIVIDPNGLISEHNTSILELLNINSEKLRGRNFFDFIVPEDQNKAREMLSKTKNSGYRKNIEFRIKRDDSHHFVAETSFGLICEQENLPESYVIIIKKIDERKAYETNLRIAKEKAEESDRLKTAFLSNMSHEIRTPMNAIVGFSELLSTEDVSETDKKEFISQINLGAETLMRLIDDIIDIAKIESGQIIIHKTNFLLSELLNELKIVFSKTLERSGKTKIKLIPDHGIYLSDIPVYTDLFRLKQVFSNLISNAIKFTETGEIRFGIKMIDNKLITFYVKDSGIGIENEKQKLIFERFRQGHESKTNIYGGTGLGLAISKNLTELLGGNISVSSKPGNGAEFCFSIPFITSLFPDPSQKTYLPEIILELPGKTILIAEDEESNFTFLAEALKKSGATIIRAKDGNQAVDLFLKNPQTDLVLMDIRLPFQNGYDATHKIKKIRAEIPVIAQTAYAMAGERQQSILAGCDDFITKPVKLAELYMLIKKHLKLVTSDEIEIGKSKYPEI